jgi:hypothetical protein
MDSQLTQAMIRAEQIQPQAELKSGAAYESIGTEPANGEPSSTSNY